jgi:hypothetical protein
MPALDTIITFKADGMDTIVKVNSKVGSKEEVEKLVEMGMIEGFTETWDRLEEHLFALQEENKGQSKIQS